MPCFANGIPIGAPAAAASRYRLTDFCVALGADTIAISFVAPEELQMEQLITHWAAVPAVSESIVLAKISVDGFRFDTVLRSVDPNAEAITDLVCIIPFRWATGDTVQLTYANTDDQDVGSEIMLIGV